MLTHPPYGLRGRGGLAAMNDAPVLLQRMDDGIAVVRLNRPDKRNALDSAALAAFNDLLATTAKHGRK